MVAPVEAVVKQSELGSPGFWGQKSCDLLFGMILAQPPSELPIPRTWLPGLIATSLNGPSIIFSLNKPDLTSFATCVYKPSQTHQHLSNYKHLLIKNASFYPRLFQGHPWSSLWALGDHP